VSDGWRIEERVAPPADLHASWPSVERNPSARAVARCRPTGTAVVLGSTQPPDVVAGGTGGIDVVRRRSGGGAVLVTPADPVWIDVWVPAADPLWTADVTGAFLWLGSTWGSALERLGLTGVVVQGSAPGACTRWSALVCFGGVGAGEVTVDARKVVGLAQRRTRHGAWFHGACVVHWDPTVLLGALALDRDERDAAAAGLAGAVAGVADAAVAQGSAVPPSADAVAGAFLDALTEQ
jgi:lipoate-protein ligase A